MGQCRNVNTGIASFTPAFSPRDSSSTWQVAGVFKFVLLNHFWMFRIFFFGCLECFWMFLLKLYNFLEYLRMFFVDNSPFQLPVMVFNWTGHRHLWCMHSILFVGRSLVTLQVKVIGEHCYHAAKDLHGGFSIIIYYHCFQAGGCN